MAGDDIRETRNEFTSEEPVLERPSTYPEAPTRLTSGGMAMGPHHYLHCRDLTGDAGCTLVFAGHEDELEHAAVHHMTRHGHEDTDDMRMQIRRAMKKIPPGFFS